MATIKRHINKYNRLVVSLLISTYVHIYICMCALMQIDLHRSFSWQRAMLAKSSQYVSQSRARRSIRHCIIKAYIYLLKYVPTIYIFIYITRDTQTRYVHGKVAIAPRTISTRDILLFCYFALSFCHCCLFWFLVR